MSFRDEKRRAVPVLLLGFAAVELYLIWRYTSLAGAFGRFWMRGMVPTYRHVAPDEDIDRLAAARAWFAVAVTLVLAVVTMTDPHFDIGRAATDGLLSVWIEALFLAVSAAVALLVASSILLIAAPRGSRRLLLRSLWVVWRVPLTVVGIGLVIAHWQWISLSYWMPGDSWIFVAVDTVFLFLVVLPGTFVISGTLIVFAVRWLPQVVPEYFRAVDGHPTMRALVAINYFTARLALVPYLQWTVPDAAGPLWAVLVIDVGGHTTGLALGIWELRLMKRRHGWTIRRALKSEALERNPPPWPTQPLGISWPLWDALWSREQR